VRDIEQAWQRVSVVVVVVVVMVVGGEGCLVGSVS
jgi:hypothetical protein